MKKMLIVGVMLLGLLASFNQIASAMSPGDQPPLVPAGTWHSSAGFSQTAAELELYGTFEAMGIIVNLTAGEDPDADAVTQVEYRQSGAGSYRQGFPLSRVDATRFVGSLFWLEPGTGYDIRVTFSDPDGGPLNGAVVSASQVTQAEITVPAASETYIASPTGSGTTCSLAAPCSLTQAISQAQAGQEVLLRDGVYYQGEIALPRSGSVGAPIVIRSYPGETAILDGGDPATFAWSAQGGGVYRATVNASDTHLVTANGQRIYPYGSLADLQNLAWGIPGFYVNGNEVSVRLAGDADPNLAAIHVSRYNHAFYVGENYIDIIGLTFRHYGRSDYAKAIYLDTASNNLIRGCTFAINDLGIGIKRPANRNVIEQNTFYDTIFDWPWDAVKAGSGLETGGIRFYSPSSGRGTIIRYNTFHDFFDGFGACPDDTDGVTNETDVYENLVYRVGDDGMETDGQCSNVRIWGNTFHDVLVGISLAPVYDGPVYALRNLIYNTGAGNNDYSGFPFKFNSGYDQSGPMFLFHNTSDAALPGGNGFALYSPGSWTQLTARNNIWAGTEYALYNANPIQPLDLDYDNLYTTLPGELVWWAGLSDRHLNTLAELQTATNQEMNGFNLPPGFKNPGAGDYTLSAASQMLDKGLVIPGINDDYGGSAPDLGAFEFVPSLVLNGTSGIGAIFLHWQVNTILPVTTTWHVDYYTQTISIYTATNVLSTTRSLVLTEHVQNYQWYTITLHAMLGSTPFLTDTVRVMPTDRFVYLPLVLRGR
jgi:parallel beta-helix repeat protein